MDLLIAIGIVLGTRNDQGKTPLHLLCENNPNEEVLIQTNRLFLEKEFNLKG